MIRQIRLLQPKAIAAVMVVVGTSRLREGRKTTTSSETMSTISQRCSLESEAVHFQVLFAPLLI